MKNMNTFAFYSYFYLLSVWDDVQISREILSWSNLNKPTIFPSMQDVKKKK